MEIQVQQTNLAAVTADTLIVNLFKGVTQPGGATGALDEALNGAISELIAQGDLSGKLGEVGVCYPRGAIPARRVLIVGLGEAEKFDLHAARSAAAAAAKRARDLKAEHIATIIHGADSRDLALEAVAQATVEGALLGLHAYAAPKQLPEALHVIQSLTVVEAAGDRLAAVQAGVSAAQAVAAGVTLARNLVQGPANVVTPQYLAEAAQALADEHGLSITVGGRKWAAARHMGAFLAVARGAGDKPRFIVLEYNPKGSAEASIVLVGKGITFDTGGITLKPGERMDEMKSDMGGAAAVLGALKAAALLKLPRRIIGIAPCTENKPDAHAYRPGDVITASNGKTIEIISTDAEGRMVLADALVYAQQYQPAAVIDLATLTGAIGVALGEGVAAGIFSNDDKLRAQLVAAGTTTHERLWPMPLWDDYRKVIDSTVADIKNSGGRGGGVGSSAIFLKEFTDYPWAHLDIANMAFTKKVQEYETPGATGFGVRLLVEFLRQGSGQTA